LEIGNQTTGRQAARAGRPRWPRGRRL